MSAKLDVSYTSVLVWCNERGCENYREWAGTRLDGYRLAARHENAEHPWLRTANANLSNYLKRLTT